MSYTYMGMTIQRMGGGGAYAKDYIHSVHLQTFAVPIINGQLLIWGDIS